MDYFIIGILGSGTQALASLLIQMGHKVSGVDKKEAILNYKGRIDVEDINFFKPQRGYFYIYGNAFKDHPLTLLIKSLGYDIKSYKEALAELPFHTKIQVSASHGKTFTTSLLAHMLASSCLVGDGSAKYQNNLEFVYEGCEYQNTFLSYCPNILIILNIDYDHVDFFKTREQYFEAFRNASKNASTLIIEDSIRLDHPNKHSFSLSNEEAELYGKIILENEEYSLIRLKYKDMIKEIKSPFVTKYENENLLAAILACLLLGRSLDEVLGRLKSFKRPKRRMDVRHVKNKILVLDYAHHPSQLKALYEYINNSFPSLKKLIIYEGHTLSRSLYFKREYKDTLAKFDKVYLYPIYYAREEKCKSEREYYRYLKFPKYKRKSLIKDFKKNNFVFIFAGAGEINFEFEKAYRFILNAKV